MKGEQIFLINPELVKQVEACAAAKEPPDVAIVTNGLQALEFHLVDREVVRLAAIEPADSTFLERAVRDYEAAERVQLFHFTLTPASAIN